METPTPRLHPLLATAALAVTVFSLAGIAALSGLLPTTRAAPEEAAPAPAPMVANATVPPARPAGSTLGVPTIQAPSTTQAPPAPQASRPAAKPAARAAPKPASAPVAAPAADVPAAPAVVAEAAPPPPAAPAPVAAVPCANCGVIDNVREVEQEGTGSGIGAVAGGVLGGVLGNQVGKGNGNKLATILGAVGGAYAGHQVEKSRNKTVRYEITVRMADGSLRTLSQDSLPAWRIGERVRVENGTLLRDDAAAPDYGRN